MTAGWKLRVLTLLTGVDGGGLLTRWWPLVALLMTLFFGAVAVVGAQQTVLQVRADTAVRAVPDENRCEVTFSDAQAVERTVELRRHNATCLQPDADGTVTVYYDVDDPDVVVAGRWWPLAAAGAVGAAGVALLAARATVRALAGLRGGPAPPRRSR